MAFSYWDSAIIAAAQTLGCRGNALGRPESRPANRRRARSLIRSDPTLRPAPSTGPPSAPGQAALEVYPPDAVKRRAVKRGDGIAAEIVQATRRERLEFRFCARVHLLGGLRPGRAQRRRDVRRGPAALEPARHAAQAHLRAGRAPIPRMARAMRPIADDLLLLRSRRGCPCRLMQPAGRCRWHPLFFEDAALVGHRAPS